MNNLTYIISVGIIGIINNTNGVNNMETPEVMQCLNCGAEYAPNKMYGVLCWECNELDYDQCLICGDDLEDEDGAICFECEG